jgi:protein-ribulosamine 3-kinase
MLQTSIIASIEKEIGTSIEKVIPQSGGSICDSYLIKTNSDKLFVKTVGKKTDMFHKEASGLNEIAKSKTIEVPEVIQYTENYLLLEFIESSKVNKNTFYNFGVKLARLHKYTSEKFGFYENNYIGSTSQINLPESVDWIDFYWNNRLGFQLELARKNGYMDGELEKLSSHLKEKLSNYFKGMAIEASLIHGDLWSGNYLVNSSGEVSIIDPAVYYGHREAELVMTKMFGRFPQEFYRGYEDEYPLDKSAHEREGLYLLYHTLNHLNLFGSSYYNQCISLLKRYC